MKFGVWIPNCRHLATPAIIRDAAVRAEQLGYDSLWVYDHFHNVPKPSHEAVFECWTTMAALAEATSRIRLGQMVGCALYRPPALAALEEGVARGLHAPRQLAAVPGLSVRYLDSPLLARFGEPEAMFVNLNRPEDVRRWRERAGAG